MATTNWDTLIKACILLETTLKDKLRQVQKDRTFYETQREKELSENTLKKR
jgi:hypothetical protein